MNIFDIAKQNQEKAWQVIKNTNIIQIWEDAGAKINLVGSLRTGLLMKHRDIDFHIYSSPLNLADSFLAMARLAENPSIKRIECANLLHTSEACIEWHAWYQNEENELWQMDMIHIREGSRYDGYFEKVAQRISEIMTDEIRETILRLKYETPETEKIIGVEYYQAVIRDGVRDYSGFKEWRKQHPVTGVVEWSLDPMKSGISLTAPTPVLGVLPPKSFVLPAYATDFAGEYGRYEY